MARRGFLVGGGAVAASVAAAAVVRPPLGLWPSLADLRADYRTKTGERRTIALAQGLSVELNTRTSLARRGGEGAWRLALISGEVAVDAQGLAEPVAVMTGEGAAMATRGRFAVRLEGGETCVTCFAGQVAVTDAQGRRAALDEGGRIILGRAGAGRVDRVDVAQAEAWRRGELVFMGQPLREVVDEINRYRPGKIMLAKASLGGIPVNAVFRINGLDRAVTQISEVANATVTSLPGGVVLLS